MTDDDGGDGEEDEGEEDWQGWCSETGSLFQRWSDACPNERFVIFNKEARKDRKWSAWGRARVTTEKSAIASYWSL